MKIILSAILLSTSVLAQAPVTSDAVEARLLDKIEALEKRVEDNIQAQKDIVAIALAAQKEAVLKAEASMNIRLEGMNEFRLQMKDQVSQYPTRQELWGYLTGAGGVAAGLGYTLAKKGGREEKKKP
jgi:hypothetical protein